MNERDTLLDLLNTLKKAHEFDIAARTHADSGTATIEAQTEALLTQAKLTGDDNDAFMASSYLSEAAISLWKKTNNLEPVLYLGTKYYVPFSTLDNNEDTWQDYMPFVSYDVFANVSADLQGQDRVMLVDHAINFFAEQEEDMYHKMQTLTYFALRLSINGLLDEGKELAETVKVAADDDFKSQFAYEFSVAETGIE